LIGRGELIVKAILLSFWGAKRHQNLCSQIPDKPEWRYIVLLVDI